MRSIRSWAYKTFGNDRAVAIVAMATPEDLAADAEHIRMADQFVEVPGGSNNNNYANVPLIVQVADRANVDAVWPGWGHASEKPELPTSLAETAAGIRFLGPGAAAMAALGDKIGSTILAQAAGVPTIPWSGTGVAVDFASCAGVIPPDVYDSACIHTTDQAVASCASIGYPVMLKASWGGGGKGIRKVSTEAEVAAAFRAVQGEVPGSPIFAMKLAPPSRHLEVQLLADAHGGVTSVYSRDCSVQRRHQKIVEEGPVSKAPPAVLAKMEACARSLARAVGYVGAATVEYLYALETGEFFFLELNPRLQVEHPVTEWISGVNIPSVQLLVGMGVPLHRIPDIRRLHGQDPAGVDPIDFEAVPQVPSSGHVVAVRVTSEDANVGFKPTCGELDELSFRTSPDVWGYFSVKSGGRIHEFSDSQFGHLFAKGETREAAIRSMVVALKEVKIRGEIRTIVDYAVEMIQDPAFVHNQIHTGWLDARIAAQVRAEKPAWYLAVIAGALLRALDAAAARSAEYLGYLEKGQLPPARLTLTSFDTEFVLDGMKYRPAVIRRGPQAFRVSLGGGEGCAPPSAVDVVARRLNDGGLHIQADGQAHVVHAEEEAGGTRLTIDALTCLLETEADPSRLVAPSPGKLVRYLVEDGAAVTPDTPYAEIEVMKMLMPLLPGASGVLTTLIPEGGVLAAGDLIARLALADAASIPKAQPYTGGFPECGPPLVHSQGVDHRFKAAREAAKMVMAGYDHPPDAVVADLLACLDDPALALLQWTEVFAVVQTRIPGDLATALEAIAAAHEADLMACGGGDGTSDDLPTSPSAGEGSAPAFPARPLLAAIAAAVAGGGSPSESAAITAAAEPLVKIAEAHASGKEAYARCVVTELFEDFLAVEERFAGPRAAAGAAAAAAGVTDGAASPATASSDTPPPSSTPPPPAAAPAAGAANGAAAPPPASASAAPGGPPTMTDQEVIDSLRGVYAGNLGAVVDIVVAHQGLPTKVRLAALLMGALVLPAPQAYRPLLRRMAALGPAGGEASARAQQLLEHSLLAELQAVVARALSGLDMFQGARLSGLDLLEPGGGKGGAGSGAAPAPATPPDEEPIGSLDLDMLQRRTTVVEGLYTGLMAAGGGGGSGGAPTTPGSASAAAAVACPSLAATALDAKVRLLVEAPAAVEDALASLLDSRDATLAVRALTTYVKRVYHPFLLQDPFVVGGPTAGPTGPGGSGAGAAPSLDVGASPDELGGPAVPTSPPPAAAAPLLAAAWVHEHPSLEATPAARAAVGAAVVVGGLDQLASAVAAADAAVEAAGLASGAAGRGTLHVVLTRGGDAALRLTPDAAAHAQAAGTAAAAFNAAGWGPGAADPWMGADPRPAVAAVIAAVKDVEPRLLAAGYEAVSVLTKVGLAVAPLRVGLWRRHTPGPDGAPRPGYWPDPLLCAVEPPTAHLLDLARLAPLGPRIAYAPSRNRQAHTYAVTERRDARSLALRRVFVRGAVRQLGRPALLAATYKGDAAAVAAAAFEEVGASFAEALAELERSAVAPGGKPAAGGGHGGSASGPGVDWAHVYLTVLPPLPLGAPATDAVAGARVAAALKGAAAALLAAHGPAVRRVGLAQWEVRLRTADGGGAWRVVVASPTGHETGEEYVEVYREAAAPAPGDGKVPPGMPIYSSATAAAPGGGGLGEAGPLAGTPLLAGYPALAGLQQKRLAARRHRTTYCYDFPSVFENALRGAWAARAAAREPGGPPPATHRLVEAQEMVVPAEAAAAFASPPPMLPISRPVGANDCGVVAWVLTLRTPECPAGRRIVAVANDITFNSGAFGPREDTAFRGATELALSERLPLVYLAANSGARVGLAAEVKACLQVEWSVPADPSKGPAYLWLADEDYKAIISRSPGAVRADPVPAPDGSGTRWRLTDVIGSEDGLGVENLSGSGAIASAYCKAFREGFTLTLVSGRTVGIGAYLARLGRRCIQRSDQPIILTGYAALNKVLGREVYSSHMQLGGPRVMGVNGVAHQVVDDDLQGIAAALAWLAYVPACVGGVPPLLASADPVDRPVSYRPGPNEKLDPRAAIAGRPAPPSLTEDGGPAPAAPPAPSPAPGAAAWQAGLFDRGSWTEAQAGWARTVVTGRARLGGLPVGVIAVESSTVMLNIPADPGAPDSAERIVPQAGQVWFPDSALKTAHAMEEFDAEGLPLVILANWRGFSGGQRDLFEGVLQAGSLIVDQLRTYRQPVFVYLPPGAELRGGAWVVVDAQINAGRVEMYADPAARGGVLEPEGLVEIKFRTPDLLAAMQRLDPAIAAGRRTAAAGGPGAAAAAAAVAEREAALLPAYRQAAVAFADMHDTPVRMAAKGVLAGIVPWSGARAFLARRLRRRLAEDELAKHVAAADAGLGVDAARALIKGWFEAASASPGGGAGGGGEQPAPPTSSWADDAAFLGWAASGLGGATVAAELKALRSAAAARAVAALAESAEGRDGLVAALEKLVAGDAGVRSAVEALAARRR